MVNLEEICPYQGGSQAQFFLINDKKGSNMDVFFGEVCLKNSLQIFALIKSSRLLSRGSSLIQAKITCGIFMSSWGHYSGANSGKNLHISMSH